MGNPPPSSTGRRQSLCLRRRQSESDARCATATATSLEKLVRTRKVLEPPDSWIGGVNNSLSRTGSKIGPRTTDAATFLPATFLYPPRALRIGPALDKHLVRRKPQLIKRVEEDIEAATSRPGSATHARRERSRKHAERAARAEWLASKAEQSKARSETGPATMTPEDAEAEVIADRNRREGAYVSWLDRKREEHEKKILARMHAAGKALNVKGFEIRDLRRVYDTEKMPDAVYKLVDKFMLAVQTEMHKISPEHVQEILVQASAERRLQTKVAKLQKQAKDDSSITVPRTKEEQAAQRARMKVGEHMMTSLESAEQYQRTLFGVVIKSVFETFDSIDRDANGHLDKDEFKQFCSRMDLGLSVPQASELWDCLDMDASGHVSRSEFEEYLLDVKAFQIMHTHGIERESARLESQTIVRDLHLLMGDRELDACFTRLFGAALDTRLAIATKSKGMIELWEFRTALRKVETKALTPFQRASMRSVFDQLFRRLDDDRSNRVRIDDVLFFVRSAMMKVHELAKGQAMSPLEVEAEARKKLLLKLGKMLWDRAEATVGGTASTKNKRAQEHDVYEHFGNMLRQVDAESTRHTGHVTMPSFVKLFKLLDFNLTTSQETTIFNAIDTDESGTIEHAEFIHFLKTARVLLDKKAMEDTEANDPRNFNVLVECLLRNMPDKPRIVEPILINVRESLTGDGASVGAGWSPSTST